MRKKGKNAVMPIKASQAQFTIPVGKVSPLNFSIEYISTNPIESLSETIHKGLKSLRAYFVNANVEPQNITKRDK